MKNKNIILFVLLIAFAISTLTACDNNKTPKGNEAVTKETEKPQIYSEETEKTQIYSDEYLGKWYGFGTDNVVTTSIEFAKVDEKTAMITNHDGQTDNITFSKADYAESAERSDGNGRKIKTVYTFGSDNQGEYFEFHSVNISDGSQLSERMYCYRNAVIIDEGQSVESLTANGEKLEKGYFNARYNALKTDSIPGDTQIEMNEASHEIYEQCDRLLNDIYTCLEYMLPETEFSALEKDEVNWIKKKENAVSEEEKNYLSYDMNGNVNGRGTMAPLAMNCVNIDYTKKRCEYLITLIK